MEQYSLFEVNQVTELTVIKKGLFNPSFTLTDGVNIYGRLSFNGWWKNKGFINTATGNWILTPQNIFGCTVWVKDADKQVVATVKTSPWTGKVSVMFTNGDRLVYKRNGVFSKIQSWYSDTYGKLMNIKIKVFNYSKPFSILFDPIISKSSIDPLLLALMGINVILVRRREGIAANAN